MTLVETAQSSTSGEKVVSWHVWEGEALPHGPHPDLEAAAEEAFRQRIDRAPEAIAEILALRFEQDRAGQDVGNTALSGAA